MIKTSSDQIIIHTRFIQKIMASFLMPLILLVAGYFFEDFLIFASVLAGTSIMLSFFMIGYTSPEYRIILNHSGVMVKYLFRQKKHEWADLKSIRSYYDKKKTIVISFTFHEKPLNLTPELLGALNNLDSLENRQLVRDFLKLLVDKHWVVEQKVQDGLS